MAFWKKPTDVNEAAEDASSEVKTELATPNPRSNALEEDLLRRFGRIRSALSPGTIIQGKLSFDSPVRIDGKLTGDVFSSQTLLIGQSGLVEANIEAETVVVLGKLAGTVKAKSRIEIMPGAQVEAVLIAGVIVIHEGAIVQGRCEMGLKKK